MEINKQTNAHEIESYLNLIIAFRELPETKRGRTFMEVSGNPHYENVASNILAFYFDPAAEHGLKDLLISAFLHMAGEEDVPQVCDVVVNRELSTYEGKRIDLTIDSEAFTIGIENKINHWLANDLEKYAEVIDGLGRKKDIVIKAVLGLRPILNKEKLKGGFISYTYDGLWKQVRQMLGHYISKADPKWVTYLIDFMETITNLAGQNMEINKTDRFFIEHNDRIEQMLAERNAFVARLGQKVVTLASMMSEVCEASAHCKTPWVYDKFKPYCCVVFDFTFANTYLVSFDLWLKPTGWELQLFARQGVKNREYLIQLISNPDFHKCAGSISTVNDRFIVQSWSIETDLEAIRDDMRSWICTLVKAAEAKQN